MALSTNGSNEQRPRGFFRNKAIVITGASSGIGEDVAVGFARHGAGVALLARRKSVLDVVAGRIDAAGGRALAIACDVTQARRRRRRDRRGDARIRPPRHPGEFGRHPDSF
jgi:short-subunit dehydrogenase